jgi:hypothetical protein
VSRRLKRKEDLREGLQRVSEEQAAGCSSHLVRL